MALIDVATRPSRLALVLSLPKEDRFGALAGANPRLVAEIERLKHEPRRTRALTAESVEEAVGWIDDPEQLKAIVAHDTRKGVVECVRYRIMNLKPEEPVVLRSNEANIINRTERALAHANAVDALCQLVEHDWDLISKWYLELPAKARSEMFAPMMSVHPMSTSFFAMAFGRILKGEDPLPEGGAEAFAKTAQSIKHGYVEHFMTRWQQPADELFALLAVTVGLSPGAFPDVPLEPAAVKLLADEGRWDIIASRRAMNPEELRDSLAGSDTRQVLLVMALCDSADYIDALCEVLVTRPEHERRDPSANGLDVPGISAASRALLLSMAWDHRVASAVANERVEMPVEEVVSFAKAAHTYSNIKLDALMQRLGCYAMGDDEQQGIPVSASGRVNLEVLIDTMYEHTPGLVDVMRGGYYKPRTSWVTRRIMQRLSAEMINSPETWNLFFATAEGFTGTSSELATVINSLQ